MGIELKIKYKLEDWYSEKSKFNFAEKVFETLLNDRLSKNPSFKLSPTLKDLPEPSSFFNIIEGSALFITCLREKKKIMIVGDYDVDGITSTALFIRFFKKISYTNYSFFIPNRFKHGYGLTQNAVEVILKEAPDLVVTVDNGITAKVEVEILKQNQIDVIITDHHSPKKGNIPDCFVINPKLEECNFPDPTLSGVGVALYFLLEVRKQLREANFFKSILQPNLLEDLDIVAIGTVADQVELNGVNRVITFHGIELIKKQFNNSNTPYTYLKVLKKYLPTEALTSEYIAFSIAPLLNASGRLSEAEIGLDFLLEEDEYKCEKIYLHLKELNVQRRSIEKDMFQKALADTQNNDSNLTITFHEDFHEGVIGIVASKLVEEYNKPAIVFALGDDGVVLKGSARSVAGVDIGKVLKSAEHLLIRFGGHVGAAGCSMKRENFEKFIHHFSENLLVEKRTNNEIQCDLEVELWMLSKLLFRRISYLEPFGQANQKPLLVIRKMHLDAPRIMKDVHLKWDLSNEVEIVFWNGAHKFKNVGHYDIVFSLNLNTFNQREKIQLNLKSLSLSA